nr:transposase [Prevotella corporis]
MPSDNNASERVIRKLKIRQKISRTFRSDGGVDAFFAIHSISGTARRNQQSQINAISTILSLLDGRWLMPIAE